MARDKTVRMEPEVSEALDGEEETLRQRAFVREICDRIEQYPASPTRKASLGSLILCELACRYYKDDLNNLSVWLGECHEPLLAGVIASLVMRIREREEER